MPQRIQRKRTNGWKMPPNTVYVGRPTIWGNPYIVKRNGDYWQVWDSIVEDWIPETRSTQKVEVTRKAIEIYKSRIEVTLDFTNFVIVNGEIVYSDEMQRRIDQFDRDCLEPLRKADYIACWCNVDQPCHADVWLDWLEKVKTKQ